MAIPAQNDLDAIRLLLIEQAESYSKLVNVYGNAVQYAHEIEPNILHQVCAADPNLPQLLRRNADLLRRLAPILDDLRRALVRSNAQNYPPT